ERLEQPAALAGQPLDEAERLVGPLVILGGVDGERPEGAAADLDRRAQRAAERRRAGKSGQREPAARRHLAHARGAAALEHERDEIVGRRFVVVRLGERRERAQAQPGLGALVDRGRAARRSEQIGGGARDVPEPRVLARGGAGRVEQRLQQRPAPLDGFEQRRDLLGADLQLLVLAGQLLALLRQLLGLLRQLLRLRGQL